MDNFKLGHAGKMNFYCSVVDDKLKHATGQPTISLILCQMKDRILAKNALRGTQKPIGVSDYELTRALPDNLKISLPSNHKGPFIPLGNKCFFTSAGTIQGPADIYLDTIK